MKVTEKQITASIRQLLKNLGIFHYKQHQGLGSTPGVPDIVGIYKGRYLGIEVKAPNGKLSPKQTIFLQTINDQGGIALVARSIEDVIRGLGIEDRFLNFEGK